MLLVDLFCFIFYYKTVQSLPYLYLFTVDFLKTALFSSQNKQGTFQRSELKHMD